MRRVHVVFGAGLGVFLASWVYGCGGFVCLFAWFASGGLGGWFPDLDLGLGGHRRLLHNVFALAAASLLAYLAAEQALGAAVAPWAGQGFAWGYASHLALDMLTRAGIALLYPLTPKRIRIAHLHSGSKKANQATTATALTLLALGLLKAK